MGEVSSATRWLVLKVEAPFFEQRPALVEGLLSLGGGVSAVEERGNSLITYHGDPGDVESWLARVRVVLREAAGVEPDIEWRWQADEDWSETWKRGLRPRRVGRHFIVTPSWAEPELREGDHVIVIDPEMAFGTGEHATTRGALRFIEQITKPGMCMLDVGTGSAILAIGAALLGADHVLAVDLDPDAILNAKDNVERNHAAGRITLEERAVDEAYLFALGESAFDIIAANVLSSVLEPLLPSFLHTVRPGGHVILGGILEEEADDVLYAATQNGFRIIAEDLEDEWWGVLLQRPA